MASRRDDIPDRDDERIFPAPFDNLSLPAACSHDCSNIESSPKDLPIETRAYKILPDSSDSAYPVTPMETTVPSVDDVLSDYAMDGNGECFLHDAEYFPLRILPRFSPFEHQVSKNFMDTPQVPFPRFHNPNCLPLYLRFIEGVASEDDYKIDLSCSSRLSNFYSLMLYKAPFPSSVLTLTVDPQGYWFKDYRKLDVCKQCGRPLPEEDQGVYTIPLRQSCICHPLVPRFVKAHSSRVADNDLALLLSCAPGFQTLLPQWQKRVIDALHFSSTCGYIDTLSFESYRYNPLLLDILEASGLAILRPTPPVLLSLAYKWFTTFSDLDPSVSYELILALSHFGLLRHLENMIREASDPTIFSPKLVLRATLLPSKRTHVHFSSLGDPSKLTHAPIYTVSDLELLPEEASEEEAQAADLIPPHHLRFPRFLASLDQKVSSALANVAQEPKIWEPFHMTLLKIFPKLPPLSPDFKKSFVLLHLHFLFERKTSVSFLSSLVFAKQHMSTDEVLILDTFHALYMLLRYVSRLLKIFESGEEAQARIEKEENILVRSLHGFIKLLLPINDPTLLNDLNNRLRCLASLKSFSRDFWSLLQWLVGFVVEWYRVHVVGVADATKAFCDKVDSLEEVFVTESGQTTSLRTELTKNKTSRLTVLALLSQGRLMLSRLERSDVKKETLIPLKDRVRKLEKIISGNQATFVGCEGKVKPYALYIHGAPGVGKTCMLTHLAHDLCYVLDDLEFDEARDIYAFNPDTPYHDQYAYQRFTVCNDVFQMKDEQMRNTEIFNLIQMTDESPYPLNIAECSGKGTIYFASPFVFLTSNFDMSTHLEDLASRMENPSAIVRRMNLYIEVLAPNVNPEIEGFQRDAMRFMVYKAGQDRKAMDWWELVEYLKKDVSHVFFQSEAISKTKLTDQEKAKIDAIKRMPSLRPKVLQSKDSRLPLPQDSLTPPLSTSPLQPVLDKLETFRKQEETDNTESTTVPLLAAKTTEEAQSFFACPVSLPSRTYLTLHPPHRFLRFLAGYYWPHFVLSPQARMYCELYDDLESWTPFLSVMLRIFAIGAPIYWIHNMIMHFFRGEGTQAGGGIETSGAEFEVKPRRRPKRQGKFRSFELAEAGAMVDGWESPNGPIVQQRVVNNMAYVVRGDLKTNGIFVFGHVLLVPLHLFSDPNTDQITVLLRGCCSIPVDMSELPEDSVMMVPDRQLLFIDLSYYLKNYPIFSDLRSYFISPTSDSDYQTPHAYLPVLRGTNATGMLTLLPIENVNPCTSTVQIRDAANGRDFPVVKSIRGTVRSGKGDCGSVWILDRGSNGGAKIAGVHISGDPSRNMGRASVLTKRMIDEVAAHYRYGMPKTAVTMPDVTDLVVDLPAAMEEFQALDFRGMTNIVVPQASKTALRKSIWQGFRPPTTAPARLRPFYSPQGEIKPHVINFQKYAGQRQNIPQHLIYAAMEGVRDWYPRIERSRRRVLTLEQAVFGEANGYNPSIKTDTSVGYPFILSGQRRTDYFTLEPQWISDKLRSLVQSVIKDPSGNLLILDNLKDERLKLSKVEKGDTRIFSILPFTFNIALKIYFGDFLFYVKSLFPSAPVKMGISAFPDDWTQLYNYLNDNQGGLIAGDYSGWDRKAHFEVFMSLVDYVNWWYDDGNDEVRRRLARAIFESEHYLMGNIYSTKAGMPSGCYLTTLFNSLANLVYWYLFIISTYGELPPDHQKWFIPAIYGDDHIVSVRSHPEINMISFGHWIQPLGLKYTDAQKELPTVPYLSWPDVVFLKRTFRHEGSQVWGPLELPVILEMIQWYRDSLYARKAGIKAISGQILDAAANELVHHGRKVYNDVLKEMLDYAQENANLDLSEFTCTYDAKIKQLFSSPDSGFYRDFSLWSCSFPPFIPSLPLAQEEAQAGPFGESAPEASVGEIMSEIASDVPTPTTDSEGLADVSRETSSNEEVVSGTVITDAVVTHQVSGLTHYLDTQEHINVEVPGSVSSVVDPNFVFPKGYFAPCERSLPVYSNAIPSSADAYPIIRLDPLNFLVKKDFIASKLIYAQQIRFNMEIQIRILATNYHYGQLLCVFRPAYHPFLKGERKDETAILDDDKVWHEWKLVPSNWAHQGPFDTAFSASTLPSHVLSITAGQSLTFRVPWSLPYQYVPTYAMTMPRYHFGILDIYAITPILPTDCDSPIIEVFARLCDIEGYGYHSLREYCGDAKYKIKYWQYKTWSGGDESYVKIPFPIPSVGAYVKDLEIKTAQQQTGLGVLDPPSMIREKVVGRWNGGVRDGPEKQEGVPKEIAQAGEVAAIEQDTSTHVVPGPFSQLRTAIGGVMQQLGLCKPPLSAPETTVITAPSLTNSVAPDITRSTGYDMSGLLQYPRSRHSDKTQLETLAATPMYVGFFRLSKVTDTVELPLNVMNAIRQTNTYQCTPYSYIAQRFRFYRGSYHYKIHFSSSSFVNARVAVTVHRFGTDDERGLLPTQFVEVKGDTIVEGDVPFLHPSIWARTRDKTFTWFVTVKLIDPPVAYKKDMAPPIVASVWLSMRGMQVCQPDSSILSGIPWGFNYYFEGTHPPTPQVILSRGTPGLIAARPGVIRLKTGDVIHMFDDPGEKAQAGELPGVSYYNRSLHEGSVDIPTSVYHIAKRYALTRCTMLSPFCAPMVMSRDKNGLYTQHYAFTFHLNPTYFAALFRWVAGSACLISGAHDMIFDYPLVGTEYEQIMHDHKTFKKVEEFFLSGGLHPVANKMGENMIAIRQPFRSDIPFISGPHLTLYDTHENSIGGCHAVTMHRYHKPYEAIQGFFMSRGVKKGSSAIANYSLAWCFGDDLCYNQFLGIPIQNLLDQDTLAKALFGEWDA
uniref:Polyprotein n=1 Tax=Picornavirales sp. TaxID=1955153 RepID=A0A6M9Z8Y8_9VIRU|nr:MAG: polyprotein [Picornavirales sp.]